uniref:Uncharacterized protein n=1 Tax=Arundo donax TaxID=35708 RepID=A0A0A8Y515_ARUDO
MNMKPGSPKIQGKYERLQQKLMLKTKCM